MNAVCGVQRVDSGVMIYLSTPDATAKVMMNLSQAEALREVLDEAIADATAAAFLALAVRKDFLCPYRTAPGA